MAEEVQAHMIGYLTATQLWSRVSCRFATRSKAKVMQYKFQLKTLKKGNLTMKVYLGKMKNCADILAAFGHAIFKDDHILHVLSEFGLEYDSVVVHVISKTETLSMVDVAALLLAHERRLASCSIDVDTSSSSVNTTIFQPHKKPFFNSQHSGPLFCGRGSGKMLTVDVGPGTTILDDRYAKYVVFLVMLWRNVNIVLIRILFHFHDHFEAIILGLQTSIAISVHVPWQLWIFLPSSHQLKTGGTPYHK